MAQIDVAPQGLLRAERFEAILTLEFVLFVSVAIITTPVFLLQESCCRNIEQVMMATTPNSVRGLDQG